MRDEGKQAEAYLAPAEQALSSSSSWFERKRLDAELYSNLDLVYRHTAIVDSLQLNLSCKKGDSCGSSLYVGS